MRILWFIFLILSVAPVFLNAQSPDANTKGGAKSRTGFTIDSIAVHKGERELQVFNNQKLLKTYRIALGSNPIGPKQFQWDGKTPEGLYFIDGRNSESDYHKNLGISYPDDAERAWAKEFGKSAGGDIKIHGMPNGYTNKQIRQLKPDWTIGCIAVTNKEIDELYEAVEIGTPILIAP